MDLVTVTCNRDFQHMLLQAESIQKFIEPCTHWIIINEYEDLDVNKWHNALSKFYTKHKFYILTPDNFKTDQMPHRKWHGQQYFKLAVSKLINTDYLILDTKNFFIRPTSLNYWKNILGNGILYELGKDGEAWEDISEYYAKKLNTTPLPHHLCAVTPFKVDIDIMRTYNIGNLINDLYPTKEEETEYLKLNGKKLFPSEFVLYSYIAKDYISMYKSIETSSLHVIPKHLQNKNEKQIFVEIIRKILQAKVNNNIKSFAVHPLIFGYLTNTHIKYINTWLIKLGFTFQFTNKLT